MTGWRDTRPANWAKTVTAARREAEKLRGMGFIVTEPDGLEIPPHLRIAKPSVDA